MFASLSETSNVDIGKTARLLWVLSRDSGIAYAFWAYITGYKVEDLV